MARGNELSRPRAPEAKPVDFPIMGMTAEPGLVDGRLRHGLDFRNDIKINRLRALAALGVVVFHIDRHWLPEVSVRRHKKSLPND